MIRRVFLALGILAVLAGSSAGVAYASTPTQVSGGFYNVISPTGSRSADGNQFISFTFHETVTGSFSGTRSGSGTLIIHPDGTINVFDPGTFTGTIAGSRMGTAWITVEASGTFASVTAQGHLSDGAGGLAGIHGGVTVTGAAVGPAAFAGTYTGQVGYSG